MSSNKVTTRSKDRKAIKGTHLFPAVVLSRRIKSLLPDFDINLVLDVGAFHGDYCKMLRERVGYKGAIVSFEPSSASFRILKRTMKGDPEWRGFPYGLSDNNGDATLNRYTQKEMFNSVLPLRQRDARTYKVNLSRRLSESIHLQTIDAFWSDITAGVSSPRVFLKIDAQGHDIAVIRGAAEHLQYLAGIQSELPVIEIYDGMTSTYKALAFCGKLGFVPVGFYAVNTLAAYGGSSPEFDVVFKRLR